MSRPSNIAPLLLAGVLLVGGPWRDGSRSRSLRDSVDWVTPRAQAHHRAVDALTRAQTYDATHFVLDALGDHHSGLIAC